MTQPFQFRPRSTSKSPRPPHSAPTSAELKASLSSEGGYASTSANGGDFRTQGYNGVGGGAGRMAYPMNGYGQVGGAAGPGGGGRGYYYPQYPAGGAYEGVTGSQDGVQYPAVQSGYDYTNGMTNGGGQAGPSRYPYNPYYPPYYTPQYPTIAGPGPTSNQNPYLTQSPYPVYHSQYPPQHYPQHQQGYYYPPAYPHGPGPGSGNPYAHHPAPNGYQPFVPQGYVPPSPAVSNYVPHHHPADRRGQSASASGGGSISGSSVQPSQRGGTPVRAATPTMTTTATGGQVNGTRPPTITSPPLVATQLATPLSPSPSAGLQSPTVLPDTSLPLTYVSPQHLSGNLPRSMSFGEIEVDTTTAGMGVGAVVMKSPGGGAGSGVVYESVMKKAREKKEGEKKVREDSGVEVESAATRPVEITKVVEEDVLKEGQMGMGSVAVVGGDFMLAPGRPSLSSSTPTITFLITSTTPSSVVSSTKVYSGPHDGLPNGDVSKAGKKIKGKERKQDGRVEFERTLRRESGGEKLVFGTMEVEDEVEKEEVPREAIHSGKKEAVVEPEKPAEAKEEDKQPVENEKPQESVIAPVATPPATPATSLAAAEAPTSLPPAPSTPTSPPPAIKSAPKSWAALLRPPQAATPPSAPATTAPPSGLASPASPTTSSTQLPFIVSSSTAPSTSSTAPATPGTAPRAGGYAAAAFIGAASPGGYVHPPAWGGAGRQAEDLGKLLLEGLNPAAASRTMRVASVPRGIINTGNMCFANSILQVLAYCTPFTNLFEELSKRVRADLGRKTPLMEAMFQFLQEFTSIPSPSTDTSKTPTPNGLQPSLMPQTPATSSRRETGVTPTGSRREPFVPTYVYDAMKENKRFDSMRRGHQEDAEEFLGFFLETLHEEMLYLHSRHISRTTRPSPATVPNGHSQLGVEGEEANEVERPVSPVADDGWLEVGKKQKINVVRNTESKESAVSRIFGGKLRSVLHTPGQKDSITLEPYQPLQLDISPSSVYTITDALHHLHEPEVIPGVFSTSRGINVDATKQVFVETLPPILILHFKRFLYDAVEQRVVKKGKAVGYGTELVVPGEIMSPGRKGEGGKYKLFGVIYHHGSSASGGHYTASVLSQSPHTTSPASSDSSAPLVPTTWVHLDDESIQHVPVDEVIVTRDQAVQGRNGEIGGKGRERCAYLCFYQRE